VYQDIEDDWWRVMGRLSGELPLYRHIGGWPHVQELGDRMIEESKEDSYLIGMYVDNGCEPA
jgi:hypothetical protein